MKSKTNALSSRKGMTLTEVLVAMTLLVLIILVFTPAFLSYFKNVRTAGEITKKTYERASLMERLVANKGGDNDIGYETEVNGVPLKLSASGKTVDFSTQIEGRIISENLNVANSYATFYTASASNTMVCFPASLNDDFLTKDITVVPKGFKFADDSFQKGKTSGYHFEVYNTNSAGTKVKVETKYYDIASKNDGNAGLVAVFTFKGANNVISFENSPLYIQYCNTNGKLYEVKVEISAPEIIMVGEKGSDGNYYYYVTKGVDTETGNMEILAKKMTGNAELKSAMNDVEWVAKGRGDDGNGNVNQYGYYVMGGDAGQVRRFWRNETTGNYYWGGDNLVNYNRYAYLNDDGTPNNQFEKKPYETMNETLTTQASFKSIFRSGQTGPVTVKQKNQTDPDAKIKVNELFDSNKWKIDGKNDYKAFSSNYFTANLTQEEAKERAFITLGAVAKIRALTWEGIKVYRKDYRYYGSDVDATGEEMAKLHSWLTPGQIEPKVDTKFVEKFNVEGYKAATDYEDEYPWDNSLITITSVGAIQINTSNSNYFPSQGNTTFNTDVYPKKSYTLYCGYIPAVADLWGYKTKAIVGGYVGWGHVGTLGIAYSKQNESWYPVGKFGDIHTFSKTLSTDVFGTNDNDLKYQTLLNYNSESHDYNDDEKYPLYRPGNKEKESGSRWYKAGETETVTGVNAAGLALPGEGTWGSITSGKEVDVTMGYLSHPFAIALNNPAAVVIEDFSGSDYYFRNATEGKYDHEFFSSGLRDNVTMLDVKSFHDDLTGNNISLAVGYTLSYLFSDHYYLSRLGQVYNTGIVYLRATGDGTGDLNDTAGDLSAGKGWSLKKETNVFHQFFGTEQYLGNDETLGDGSNAIHGWDTDDHRALFNIVSDQNNFPGNGDAHGINTTEGTTDFGTNCHPMAQTECTTCNWGTTGDGKPQAMWGTANGTLMSWFYDQEHVENSKITSVTKEFENYTWFKKIGLGKGDDRFYDQPSVKAGISDNFGFISTLDRINDVCCADDVWVVAGNQAQESAVSPNNICGNGGTLPNGINWKPYSSNGEHASYVNVKYCVDRTNNIYLWKAVQIADSDDVNIIQLSYNQGIWYAMGYIDTNENGKNDADENAVLYWSKNPTDSWEFCKTRTSADSPNYVQNMNEATPTVALTFDDTTGNFKPIGVSGINSAASQG